MKNITLRTMKNIALKIKNGAGKALSIALVLLLATFGCTKDFEAMNLNPAGLTETEAGDALIASFLVQAQRAVVPGSAWEGYQLTNNLASEAYAGYFASQNPFGGGSNNLTYNLVPGWYKAIWDEKYIRATNPIYQVEQQSRDNKGLEDIFGFAKLLKVAAMHRVSDKNGPIIYSRYNKPNANGGIDYDGEEALFGHYFRDLDTAVAIFKAIRNDPASSAMAVSDAGYDSDPYARYLKIANTLRLRLAMRIALVDPAEAKTQGEKALEPANGGLLEDTADNWSVSLTGDHPLNTITTAWSDTRMHASMEAYLKGYNDPRLEKRWLPATDPAVAGQYKGIRTGIKIDQKSRYENYSKLRPLANRMQLMVASEAWFLRAEAALRGWTNAGDAKTNYETGVRRSFEMHGLSDAQATAYLADAISRPAEYLDPNALSPGENDVLNGSPYLSTVTIAWDNAATNDRKLERIITQKWLAIFPDGDEAWAEYRRTGYPILFPVIKNDSNGTIDSATGIRRLPFPPREYNTNRAAVDAAIVLLGGPDHGGTRLWWDVANKSF